MHPVLFRFPDWLPLLGGRAIYSYGFMLGISFIIGWTLCHRWASREGMPEKQITRALLTIIIMSLVGSRVFYFIYNPDRWAGLGGFLRFDSGGLVAYGGLILGTLTGYLYLRFVARTDFWNFADHAAPGMALGLGFTRIGCFLFGCCYGRQTDSWLGMQFPMWSGESAVRLGQRGAPAFVDHFRALGDGQPYEHLAIQASHAERAARAAAAGAGELAHQVHMAFEAKYQALGALVMGGHSHSVYPSQLLSSLGGFLIFAILLILHRHRRFRGQVLLAFAGSYAIVRFFLEMIRVDFQGGILGPLSWNQVVGIAIVGLVIPGWIYQKRRSPLAPGESGYVRDKEDQKPSQAGKRGSHSTREGHDRPTSSRKDSRRKTSKGNR
ncbi:MAG: prolipoprotein diacylglyceryl transferase [Bradymonadales bacterium]|nr:prolipoprotein diacylglyceryl transferase [Bradymonadales bacterium]